MKTLISSITHWDLICFSGIFKLTKHRVFTRLMVGVTRSGDGYLYPLAGVATAVWAPGRLKPFLLSAAVAFAIDLSAYRLIKNSVKRNRPFQVIEGIAQRVVPPDHFSFPSGHTAAAFLMAGLIGHVFPFLTGPLYLWASLVGFSRVYLGVHYPSDVVAGIGLGSLSTAVGLAIAY